MTVQDTVTTPRPTAERSGEWRPSVRERLFGWLEGHRTLLLLGGAGLTLAAAAVWQYQRIGHVWENDARVKAEMITMSSRVDGWVAARPVTDGDSIRQDQVLIVVDQRETRLQLDELRAKAQSIRLQRERTATLLRMAESTAPSAVTAAEARRAAAEARQHSTVSEHERSRRDYQRADALMPEQFVSRQIWDQRQTQLRQAEAAEHAATAELAGAQAAVADARAKLGDIDVLRKEVEELAQNSAQVEAQIRQKEISVADREVRSPIDGIVDEKFVQPGEYIIPGQRLLLVHNPQEVWIEAHVKETKLARIKPGQPVEVSVDAYPDRRFSGRVERVGQAATSEFALLPSPNPSGNFTKVTQRVPVRIAVEQPKDNPLRPGMMVEVDIDCGNH